MLRTAGLVGLVIALLLATPRHESWSATRGQATAATENLTTIEKGMTGPYLRQAVVIANSAADWIAGMAILDSAQALQVTPAPPPPADIDWSHEVVVLAAAGATGYDVTLQLTATSASTVSLRADWTPLGNDASWATAYHLVRTAKRPWLRSLARVGNDAAGALPLSGTEDVPSGAVSTSWGLVKALYH